MTTIFYEMGVMVYPITFCALMVAVLALRAFMRLRDGAAGQPQIVRSTVDGTLFWGAYAMLLGLLGTVLGVMVTAQSVETYDRVEPVLVWGGIKVALTTTVYGSLIFLVAALVWLGLRARHRKVALGGA